MELELLASTLAILARQAAPHLQEWGGQATETALKSFAGEKAKQAAQALGLLKPKLEEKPIAEVAVKTLATEELAEAEAAEAQGILERQLVLLLNVDEKLRAELEEKIEDVVKVRADRHSVAVGRDLSAEQLVTGGHAFKMTGGTVNFFQGGAAAEKDAGDPEDQATSDEDPRSAYLRWVMERAGFVTLGGVDPAVGRDKDRRLHLAAVYTALRTRTPRRIEVELEAAGKARSHEAMGREESPLSALEQLDRHDRLVLLGDPGSGKSTFLNFVALCLAGESHPEVGSVGLDLLRSPLPKEDGSDSEKPQAWSHGALLPVRVVLRDFAARGLPEAESPAAEHLWSFLEGELAGGQQAEFSDEVKKALTRGEALVLLDGLDEVPEAAQRRELICEAVLRFVEAYSESRFVVTSRTYAYEMESFHLPGFEAGELAPFGDGQIRRFARRWYDEVAELRGLLPEDARGRATLLEGAIFSSSRLRELAARPLLLTLMASLHAFRGGSLPEDREKLYENTVELLLDVWEQKRQQRDASGALVLEEPQLTEWLKVERRDVLRALQELAYEAHSSQPELVGTADVKAGDLVSRLMSLPCKTQGEDVNPKRLAEYLSQRSGILAERSDRIYTFPHRTFQEYLAARHLLDGGFDYDQIARDGRQDPNRWREVILLAAARLGSLAVWDLADALGFAGDPPDPGADAWGLHLAGHAVAETANLENVSPRNRQRLERLRRRLAGLLATPELPAGERARAGANLAHLGDPRFDEAKWFLPVDATAGFIAVPGGEYTIGSDPEQDSEAFGDEQPQHRVRMSPFWLARWPVTVAQFQGFVQASDFEVGNQDGLAGVANHPVVYVSWDEAKAYCQWLTECLMEMASERASAADSPGARRFWRGLESGEMRARLPTESQWEAAARGPEARLYPWGAAKLTEEHANFGGAISGTTPVGIYPRGRGPFGTDDQAGNVREWCADVFDEEAYAKRAGEVPVDPCSRGKFAVRVLRGGSWGGPSLFLRAAFRNWLRHGYRSGGFGFRVCVSGPEHD